MVSKASKEEGVTALPHLERMFLLDGEAPSEYKFLDLQKTAWQHYCLMGVAARLGVSSVDFAVAESFINQNLKKLAEDGAIDLHGDDSDIKLQFEPKGVPHDTLIYKVEMVLPGSAETFYEGPLGSLLWLALSGKDLSERATSRLLELTGFLRRDLAELPPEFWEQFVDCFFELSLLTLSAFLSQLMFERRKLLKGQLRYEIAHLLPNIYIHLFLHPADCIEAYWTSGLSDEELAEVGLVADRLSAEPSYHRAFGVSYSHSVADMLAAFGLHHEVLFTVTGTPRTEPARRKNAKPEKKLLLPLRGFPAEYFFKTYLPIHEETYVNVSKWPISYGRPFVWLPINAPLGMACRQQWLETQNLENLKRIDNET